MHNRSPRQNNTAPKPLFPTEISTRACRVGSGTPGGCDGRRSVLRDPCQPCAEAPFSRGFHLDACRAAPDEARRGERRLLGAGFEARGAAPRSGLPAAPLGGRLPRRPLKAEPGPCRCPCRCRCPCPPCRARPGHAPAVPPPQAAAASPAEPPGRHRRGTRPGTRSRPR